MAQHIVLKLKKEKVEKEPTLTASEEGHIDLTWDKHLYCTLKKESEGLNFIMTFIIGPNLSNVSTKENILSNEQDFQKICDKIVCLLVGWR